MVTGRRPIRPRICITSGRHPLNRQEAERDDIVRSAYSWCVAQGGGVPFILPTTGYNPDLISEYLDFADGLLLSGGEDIHPSFYGEIILERCGEIDEKRDLFEIELFRGAVQRGMPILGICRGMQVMAVALGGSLYQDLTYCQAADHIHAGAWQHRGEMSSVKLIPGTVLHEIFRKESLRVNCQHHQLIKNLPNTCRVNVVSSDGMIEGIELFDSQFVLGVHWHPERLALRDNLHLKLFKALVKIAAGYFS